MRQFSVSQQTFTELEVGHVWRAEGVGGADTKHGPKLNYSWKNWRNCLNIWSFQNDLGFEGRVCVCLCVCACIGAVLYRCFPFFCSSPFPTLLLHHLHYSNYQTSCLNCLIYYTNWCVGVCFHTIFYLLFQCSLPKGAWDIFICIQNVSQNRNWNCLFTKFKLWMRKWIVSRCQVCQHCSCVLRREIGLSKHFKHFCPIKIPPLFLYLYASGYDLYNFYFLFPFCVLL